MCDSFDSAGNDVTIAICTRNRSSYLTRCLRALENSNRVTQFRVLVIDNNSTDDTKAVVESFGYDYKLSPEIGLSHARNCALSLTKTDFIVFLDDDGEPLPKWCSAIREGLDKYSPDIFGGPYTPYYIGQKPSWFDDDFGSAHLELTDGPVVDEICFSGGNMGWRAELLRQFDGFDPTLGMIGNKLGLGEETALQVAMRTQKQLRRVFFAGMSMRHFVHPDKMRVRYIAKRSFQYGLQLRQIDPDNEIIRSASIVGFGRRTKLFIPLVMRLFYRDRIKYPYWRSYVARYLSYHMIEAGFLYNQFAKKQVANSVSACS